MDMTVAITPKSDQINADDLIAGARTFTIESVTAGSDEQPANVHLTESPGKPYRPGKSMSRVMVAAWGKDSSAYVGQRITLYRDPEISFGRDKVGGIRISHMSGIDAPMLIALTETRGKRRPFTVQPLTDDVAKPTRSVKPPTAAQVAATTDRDELRAMWTAATDSPELQASIKARVDELDALAKDGAE